MANTHQPGRAGGQSSAQGQDVKQRADEAAATLAAKTRDAAASAGERLQEAAAGWAGRAQEVAGNVGERAQEAVSGLGGQIEQLGGTVRQSVEEEGLIGSAAGRVADRLEAGGRYLQEQAFADMAADVAATIRHYPLQAVLVGLGLGFCLGRLTRS